MKSLDGNSSFNNTQYVIMYNIKYKFFFGGGKGGGRETTI